MFVVPEDFDTPPRELPNLDNAEVLVKFNKFVEKWEAKWLAKILGWPLYNAFLVGVAELPDEWDIEVAYAINDEVVRGTSTYKALATSTGIDPSTESPAVKWEVLVENERWLLIIKGSFYTIEGTGVCKWKGLMEAEVDGVFSSYVKSGLHKISGVGVVTTGAVENSDINSNGYDVSIAWNDFARSIGGRNCYDKYDTLYGFLITKGISGVYDDVLIGYLPFGQYLQRNFSWPGRLNGMGL